MKPLVLVPVLSLLVLTACGPSTPEQAPAVEYRLVKAAAVESGPAADLIEVPGIGAFRDETRLSFKVGGVIERVSVREGESVEKGQRLGALNKQDVDAAVSQASANFDKAQRDLVRGRLLREQEVIPKVQLDNLETAAQAARAQLTQARFASQTAEITAPASGLVLKRYAQVGEVVSPGQPILLVGSKSSGFVMKASLTDRQAVHMQLGKKAEVEFDALPGTSWPGKVIELSQAADPSTGTYGVLIAVDTTAHEGINLLSGMQGRARIEPTNFTGTRSYVPIEAVVEGDNKSAWLFTVQADNTVKRQSVQVAFISGNRIALQDTLPEGTRVASTGAAYLQDGETVKVQE
ncbi:RND family efflux transporter MFP subunit [Limnobacter thiooxidans]|uniref:Efflux RND transporter periplasmic adaptor subunit n=1 Tax=Limnobacter thiooxidans TaxID=131080 RepID=A0AA86J059_9BURK|nr:efflux RND transporter periplasmic adaptor subunit [Limnobacter sp.]MCZ8014867.1 efflux RND transporter periplasmic adaptor subunit [Limnobacter sp.]RZS40489.1 RND family efflux transporter MFP subunit [Limnobacter thiooxidans]BET27077.1 efflux RND transporter periplasmic adaptor subunit [Limnobacter thiooxidans]